MSHYSPLRDPRIYRDLLYLIVQFILGTLYFSILVAGYSLGLSLLILIIGLPILRLTNRAAAILATLDRRMNAAWFSPDGLAELETFDLQAAWQASRWGGLAGAGYLLGRFTLGIIAINVVGLLLPFLLIEMLLNLAGVRTGMLTANLQRALALALAGVEDAPAADFDEVEKPKRKRGELLELEADDEDEEGYILTDDGEIAKVKRR